MAILLLLPLKVDQSPNNTFNSRLDKIQSNIHNNNNRVKEDPGGEGGSRRKRWEK
jgi:hypothetical protein